MLQMIAPNSLASRPVSQGFHVPPYNWNTQSRGNILMAGRYTGSSVQTFDSRGKPKDSNSDNND